MKPIRTLAALLALLAVLSVGTAMVFAHDHNEGQFTWSDPAVPTTTLATTTTTLATPTTYPTDNGTVRFTDHYLQYDTTSNSQPVAHYIFYHSIHEVKTDGRRVTLNYASRQHKYFSFPTSIPEGFLEDLFEAVKP